MKVKYFKKIFVHIMAMLFLLIGVGALAGCGPTEHEDGYFTYQRYTKDKIRITGLTDSGAKQRFLVIPEKINGKEVASLSKENTNFLADGDSGGVYWRSDSVVEKVFFPKSNIGVSRNTFKKCENFKKAIVINYDIMQAVDMGTGVVQNAYYYIHGAIYNAKTSNYIGMKCANLTYYFNYETATNYGVYWIDDVEYGEKIEYIPNNPVREGYIFDGWYKEIECINKWAFENDSLPEELQDENEKIVYQETALYAKWIAKS